MLSKNVNYEVKVNSTDDRFFKSTKATFRGQTDDSITFYCHETQYTVLMHKDFIVNMMYKEVSRGN